MILALVLRGAVERLRPAMADHVLVLDIPADLPPVLLDPVEIDQVVANLVENAAKYTPAGAHDPGCGGRRRSASCGSSWRTTGPGLLRRRFPRLFEPFYRDSTTCIGRWALAWGSPSRGA